ncbi:hypothetical protein AJ88_15980 [Mesorhizobium amorphae CCBAU 01583]|nr:hypothetical protein AJ88_15980 [Mesorhizobium amorphae CCBAU 01583]
MIAWTSATSALRACGRLIGSGTSGASPNCWLLRISPSTGWPSGAVVMNRQEGTLVISTTP